jgi:hypothetical protein
MQDHAVAFKQIVVDLGFRGVDADNSDVQIIHRGKYKSSNSPTSTIAGSLGGQTSTRGWSSSKATRHF